MDHTQELAGLLADGVLDGGATEQTDASRLPVAYDAAGLPMIAFGIWAYDAGQDMGRVQTLLHERTGMLVPLEQLRSWRGEGRWSEIFSQVHQALEGPVLSSTQAMIVRATTKAMSTIIGIMDSPTATDSTRLKAAMTILDRGGFPVLLRGESVADALKAGSAYDDVSDEDLEAEYRSFNADTYNDRHEDMADRVTVQSYHARSDTSMAYVTNASR